MKTLLILLCLASRLCVEAAPLLETTLVFPNAPKNRPNYRIPSILQAPNGDLLIFAEKRNDGPGDVGNTDIVCKRSRDKGRTWSREQVIFDDGNRCCTDITVGIERDAKKIWLFFLRDKKQYACFTSTDSGATWQGPVSIHEQVTKPEWDKLDGKTKSRTEWEKGWAQRYGVGPGNAMVQLKSGRLVVPARHREDVGGGRLRSFSHCFYSDDRGATWKLGGTVGVNTSECQLVELANGDLMLISRDESSEDSPANLRHRVAVSKDGGATWGPVRRAEELITPRCHGAVERCDKGRLLFSSPASPLRREEHPYGRTNLTVRVSCDEGATWSAGKTVWPYPSSYSDLAVLDDGTVGLVYERGDKGSTHYWDELHFARFNLDWLGGTLPIKLASEIIVGGVTLRPESPPRGLKTDAALGVMLNSTMQASVLHYIPNYRADVMRAIKTPRGDYLAVVVAGEGLTGGKGHYAPAKVDYNLKANDLLAYRSSDKGKTWSGPTVLFPVSYSLHGFVPLIPRGSKRIYCFGTEPVPALREGRENAPIAFRYSDDDGRTWSAPTIIRPKNDPDFKGMSCLNMTETEAGTWIIGSHSADWSVPGSEKLSTWIHQKKSRVATRQYLLRSEDRGKTWTVLPGPRPHGWFLPEYERMDEARPLALGGGKVLTLARTPEGHLWEMRSDDDGKTWSLPKPTPIVQPDAPPMLFTLSDGKTLIVFHHNNHDPNNPHFGGESRNQLWFTTSTDEGRTWSEPRFVMASVNENRREQISYVDLLADKGNLHLFVPYGWKQTLHVRFNERDLTKMPTKTNIAAAPGTPNFAGQLAAKIQPTRSLIYKKIGERDLRLDIFEPANLKAVDRRACFVSIHGGGWMRGDPRAMYAFTDHCAKLGMVAVSVQYRLYKPGADTTVFECVKDARSAVRYVRAHAAELGIDPQKIIVNGASAGGHLAAATAMFDVNEAGEDTTVSCSPNALMLFSPVIDTSTEGYGNAKVADHWRELSPAHQVRRGLPPTIVFHGTADTTTPFKGAQIFHDAMLRAGNRCELVAIESAIHTYMFKDAALHAETLKRMDAFFAALGFVK